MTPRGTRRDQLEEKLAAQLLARGLARTGLRDLGAAVGTSDRMLLYYFRDKAELLEAVLARLARDLGALLDRELPADRRLPPAELLRRAADFAARADTRPYFDLWGELMLGAIRGDTALARIADAIGAGFLDFLEARLECAEDQRRAMASLILVTVDGAAFLAPVAGGAVAREALGHLQRLLE